MADKQFARSGTGDFDLLADDDPLSELARIVGYDNRPAVQQLQEIEKQQLLVRRDPVFDLEDELSREFELYDAPAHAGQPRTLIEEAPSVEPAELPFFEAAPSEAQVAEDVDAPAYEAPVVAEQSEPAPEGVEPFGAAEEQVVENENVVEAASLDESHEAASYPIVDVAPVFESPSIEADPAEMNWAPEPAFEQAPQDDLDFVTADLERELELSIGYDDVTVEHPAQAEAAKASVWDYAPVVQQDLSQHTPAPALEDDHRDLPVAADVYEHPIAIDEPVAPVEQAFVEEDWDIPEPVAEAAVETPVASHDDPNDIDALLADIERFPVPEKAAGQAVPVIANSPETVRKNNYPFTPTFSRATPTASTNGASSQKAFATPLMVTPVATTPLVEAAPEVIEPLVSASFSPTVEAEPEPDFDLDNFEIDLSDIELELDPAEFAVDTAPAADDYPVVAKASFVEPVMTQSAAPVIETEDTPDESDVTDFVLPFDPSMISETEESLTAIADLEVPHLPVVEQEKPVAYQPDYDLDIDAEIAQLFGNGARKSAVPAEETQDGQVFAAAAHSIAVTHASAQPNGTRVAEEFDEFEKAMEEDFRRSINQRQENQPVNDRLAVGGDYGNADFEGTDQRSNGKRLGLIAATVGGLLILGGAGVYAWMGGEGTGLGSSDPKIILADKSPVKVVPVEKGGKTVPNQDKAVYDRVAGAPAETLQQGTLVSSTEEPIDVVQRTLTPESLPLEGAEDFDPATVTPIDGDESARLLPDIDEAKAAEEDRATAVSPRKVRTMIVKPDGTLVAREEPAPEPVTEVALAENPVTTNGADPQIKTVKTTVVSPQAEAETAAVAETDAAPLTDLQPQQQPVTEQSALAEAASATVDETAPVRTVKTTTIGEQAPVPQTRPAEQPVNVVGTVTDQGNVRPAATETTTVAAAETTPVQTASVPAGSYVIQIASLPSEAEAQQSYTKLSGKFASVIGGRGSDIRRAEIAGKGTYYRVRIPAGSREEANSLCARYKSAGGSCLVTK
ncbi:SPOR domain-containing protein [Rhizobium sp. 32-5/1]|uniref:SPOR domain-containing protein n=1 Tax=Rhizobium sp. 32-5/1 TaxID=3019602 RepID=UPI00240E3CA2|nr:SPOR domain-containing protein [Rhizobium sp. 32-5/1]WEZ83569.1 SPOR domain-containing protein [Rhizobium sp. 32-5/1]